MNIDGFRNEFQFKYEQASKGAPDIDDYELSLLLTDASREITMEAIKNYESDEISRRVIAPLLKYYSSTVANTGDVSAPFINYVVNVPKGVLAIFREDVKTQGNTTGVQVIPVALDDLEDYLENPFKMPSINKVIRTERGPGVDVTKTYFNIFSKYVVNSYKATYVGPIEPIIISDLSALGGNLNIEGKTAVNQTELPEFIHAAIVNLAVKKAIGITRTNTEESKK